MVVADVPVFPAHDLGVSFALTLVLLVSASVVFVVVWNRLKPKR